jgi:hypothetical protein
MPYGKGIDFSQHCFYRKLQKTQFILDYAVVLTQLGFRANNLWQGLGAQLGTAQCLGS